MIRLLNQLALAIALSSLPECTAKSLNLQKWMKVIKENKKPGCQNWKSKLLVFFYVIFLGQKNDKSSEVVHCLGGGWRSILGILITLCLDIVLSPHGFHKKKIIKKKKSIIQFFLYRIVRTPLSLELILMVLFFFF